MSSAQRLGNNMVFSYNKLFIAKLVLTNRISYLFANAFHLGYTRVRVLHFFLRFNYSLSSTETNVAFQLKLF